MSERDQVARPAERRRAELAHNLEAVERRLQGACAHAGRRRDEITLVVVTKTWPAADIRLLAELGVTDVGENRDQEAAPKHDECADLGLTWHFVGQLQTNKARSVAGYADMVHSVDRERLVRALSQAAMSAGRKLTCLVQVSLDERPGGGGVDPVRVRALADAIAGANGLTLGGVMAIAPLDVDPVAAFARLVELSRLVRTDHPEAVAISAGMTGDLEPAIAAGATHVRLGTAVLGVRASLG